MKSPRTSMLRETARRMRCLHRRFPGFQGGITLRLRNSPPDDGLREVSEIMRLATRETIPVTPRGDGRGLAGAAVPTHGGISLSLERMNRILEIDRVDRVAVVEPGVVTNDLLNLMIGSEGTLGIFTKIVLNLISAPKKIMDMLVSFPDPETAVRAGPNAYFTSDIVVPFSKVPEMMRELERMEREYGIAIPTVGHIADGNLHSGLFKPDGVSVEEWPERAEEIFDEMSRIALALGGAGSGEHGVGTLKRSLFLKTKTETELALMRGIKQLFDAHGILNPGTIL